MFDAGSRGRDLLRVKPRRPTRTLRQTATHPPTQGVLTPRPEVTMDSIAPTAGSMLLYSESFKSQR